MLAPSTPSVDPQLFAAAERVIQWHRQRPSWRPVDEAWFADGDAPVPLGADGLPAPLGPDAEPGSVSPSPPPAT